MLGRQEAAINPALLDGLRTLMGSGADATYQLEPLPGPGVLEAISGLVTVGLLALVPNLIPLLVGAAVLMGGDAPFPAGAFNGFELLHRDALRLGNRAYERRVEPFTGGTPCGRGTGRHGSRSRLRRPVGMRLLLLLLCILLLLLLKLLLAQ